MSHECGGTIDGVHYPSRTALAKALGTTRSYIRHRSNIAGPRFVLHRKTVILDGFEDYVIPGPRAKRPPADFLARALGDRKLYNARGISRCGLLVRRTA